MASDINKVILIGRLTKDPELRAIQSGATLASFSVANNRTYAQNGEKKEYTSFFNCIAWGKLGEVIVQYCKKGQRIALEGRLQQKTWEDQNGQKRYAVEIVVENFQFLTTRGGAESNDSGYPEPPAVDFGSGSGAGADNQFFEDDIPF